MPYEPVEKAVTVEVAPAPVPGYVVKVYVRDSSTNLPVADASVSLDSFSGSTDENGLVQFENVPAGTYTLTVSKPGYKTYRKTVEVTGDVELEVPLEPIPPGMSYVTVTVKLFGVIPVAGVTVTVDGISGTTDTYGKVAFTLELNREYSGEATHRFLETARFRFTTEKPEVEVAVTVIPKIWILALSAGSLAVLLYLLTRPPRPVVVTA
ncbi:MAG: carboxypeptidase regulatory-like domain-containing protein [Candidatus Bathyarchaeia archaeon]